MESQKVGEKRKDRKQEREREGDGETATKIKKFERRGKKEA